MLNTSVSDKNTNLKSPILLLFLFFQGGSPAVVFYHSLSPDVIPLVVSSFHPQLWSNPAGYTI